MKVSYEYSGNNNTNEEGDVVPIFEDTSTIYPIKAEDMPHDPSHVAGMGVHRPMPQSIKDLSERLPRTNGDKYALGATAVHDAYIRGK